MSLILRQSTSVVISFGPFLDKTDGVTLEIGLVTAIDHATTGIFLSKNGGALAIRSQAVTASTYDAYGNYRVTLSTTDTNTVGTLRAQFSEAATCLLVWQDFIVVEEAMYDWLFGTAVPLSPTTAGRTLDVSAGGEAGIDWANVGSPTTAVNLSATNIDVDQVVASVSGAVGSVTGAVGSVTGNVTGTVGGFAAGQGPRIRKNVALASFPFVMTDSTNHAPATGLTVTATRSLDGAAFAACANAVTEIANGWYKISLAATDVNADTVAFRFTAAASDDLVFTVVTNP